RMAEPATSPPPHTRSNSLMPATRRLALSLAPASATKSSFRPFAVPRPFGGASPTASSTNVFHSPQLSQRPAHFGETAPQAWHTKREFARATALFSFAAGQGDDRAPTHSRLISIWIGPWACPCTN